MSQHMFLRNVQRVFVSYHRSDVLLSDASYGGPTCLPAKTCMNHTTGPCRSDTYLRRLEALHGYVTLYRLVTSSSAARPPRATKLPLVMRRCHKKPLFEATVLPHCFPPASPLNVAQQVIGHCSPPSCCLLAAAVLLLLLPPPLLPLTCRQLLWGRDDRRAGMAAAMRCMAIQGPTCAPPFCHHWVAGQAGPLLQDWCRRWCCSRAALPLLHNCTALRHRIRGPAGSPATMLGRGNVDGAEWLFAAAGVNRLCCRRHSRRCSVVHGHRRGRRRCRRRYRRRPCSVVHGHRLARAAAAAACAQ